MGWKDQVQYKLENGTRTAINTKEINATSIFSNYPPNMFNGSRQMKHELGKSFCFEAKDDHKPLLDIPNFKYSRDEKLAITT